MARLVVVAGGPNTGKLARAWELAAPDPSLRFLHRDQIRVLTGRSIDEDHLTDLVGAMAETLLQRGYGVITAAQNQAAEDRTMWAGIAERTGAALEWVETVAA